MHLSSTIESLITNSWDKINHKLIKQSFLFSLHFGFQETLVHCSNRLAVKAMRYGNSHINFVKTCLTFCEVTIPSIPEHSRQLNLYIETAEVLFVLFLINICYSLCPKLTPTFDFRLKL